MYNYGSLMKYHGTGRVIKGGLGEIFDVCMELSTRHYCVRQKINSSRLECEKFTGGPF